MLPEYMKYYYKKLPEYKQTVYLQLYQGIRLRSEKIEVETDPERISVDDLIYLLACVYNDAPSFYYLEPSKFSYSKNQSGYLIYPKYLYSEEEIKKFDSMLMQGLEAFEKNYIKPQMSDYEKEKAAHDYLVYTVTYDHDSLKDEAQKEKHTEIYNVLGALLRRKAVCWGIACAFKLLCDYCKVKCFVAIGKSRLVTSRGGHAWNIVNLEHESYHVDVTWDLYIKGQMTFVYDYFNLTDDLIHLDHTWDDTIYPTCQSMRYNFHVRNRLYVKRLDQISGYIQSGLQAGNRKMTFIYANDEFPWEKIKDQILEGMRLSKDVQRYCAMHNDVKHSVYLEFS